MPAEKFLAAVFHDATGELVAISSSEVYSDADTEATQLTVERGTNTHTGWVYKRMREASPNKAWAVAMNVSGDCFELKIVTDCVDWFEAFNKAFPDEIDFKELGIDNTWDLKVANEKLYEELEMEIRCEVIDEKAL